MKRPVWRVALASRSLLLIVILASSEAALAQAA
jgi:hypothetical protein